MCRSISLKNNHKKHSNQHGNKKKKSTWYSVAPSCQKSSHSEIKTVMDLQLISLLSPMILIFSFPPFSPLLSSLNHSANTEKLTEQLLALCGPVWWLLQRRSHQDSHVLAVKEQIMLWSLSQEASMLEKIANKKGTSSSVSHAGMRSRQFSFSGGLVSAASEGNYSDWAIWTAKHWLQE